MKGFSAFMCGCFMCGVLRKRCKESLHVFYLFLKVACVPLMKATVRRARGLTVVPVDQTAHKYSIKWRKNVIKSFQKRKKPTTLTSFSSFNVKWLKNSSSLTERFETSSRKRNNDTQKWSIICDLAHFLSFCSCNQLYIIFYCFSEAWRKRWKLDPLTLADIF